MTNRKTSYLHSNDDDDDDAERSKAESTLKNIEIDFRYFIIFSKRDFFRNAQVLFFA